MARPVRLQPTTFLIADLTELERTAAASETAAHAEPEPQPSPTVASSAAAPQAASSTDAFAQARRSAAVTSEEFVPGSACSEHFDNFRGRELVPDSTAVAHGRDTTLRDALSEIRYFRRTAELMRPA